VNCGGFLVTPNVGANNITIDNHAKGGINGSTGNPLTIVWQNNISGQLIFNQSLGGNGPPTFQASMIVGSGYAQNGLGTVSFLGINTFNVGAFLNGGVLEIAQNVCLGGFAGGAVQGTPTLPVYLNGGTLLANYTGTLSTNNPAGAHPLVLRNKGGGIAATAGNTITIDGVVTNDTVGAGPLIVGIPASGANGNTLGGVPGTGTGSANAAVVATGTVVLNNTANSYTGGTIIDSGTLQLTVNNLAVLGTGGITLNGGTFKWSGVTTDISSRPLMLASLGGTLDVNGGAVTLVNPIGNGGSGALTVASTTPGGILALSGANTFAGGITVNANSTLSLNGSSSGGSVVVSGIFGGTGTVGGGGDVIWNPGAVASLTAGTPLTVSGAVTLSGNSVAVNGSGLTSAGSPYTLLTATGGFTGGSTVNPTPGGTALAPGFIGTVSISGNTLRLIVTAVPSATWTGSGNWSAAGNWTASDGTPPAA
jgi:autotransporter-associated beta strand protein